MRAVASFVLAAATAAAADLHPIVEVETGYFFGATAGGKWIKAEKAAKQITGDITYDVYSLTARVGKTRAGKPVSVSEPCPDTLTVQLSAKPEHGAVALAAPWNALPRKPRIADATQEVYRKAVAEFLSEHGIRNPRVKITRIVRVDLDGDGEDEALISATNYAGAEGEAPMHAPKAGGYSIVLLRRVVNGKLQPQLVAGEMYPTAKESVAPNVYQINAVLDLDGDGKMEVVIESHYYEGGDTTIYRCEPGKITELLKVECGA